MRELVLDVSHWDGDVDYGRWRDQHGLWGVIVKCGGNEGGRYGDGWFESNYADARTVGLHVGAYYYTTATDACEAAEDARHCLSLISDKDFDLPVYIDVEDAGQATIGRRALTDVVLAFIRIIEDAGYSGGVYTSGSWWANNVYADELRPYANWIAWWTAEKPDAISDVGMWQFGSMRLSDGDVQHDDVGGYTDANYCYVDYPAHSGGQPSERDRTVTRIDCAERAALIHYDMVIDDRNGYSQAPVRWGGDYGEDATVHLPGGDVTYPTGSHDCSSSVCRAWQLALVGSPYEGALDEASYTGNMREVFLNSGLFYADRTPARRGDVYLNDGRHTAMCQDGGLGDGPFGYDCLSHFIHNEWGGITDGEVGDQTGEEALVQPFYEAWATTLHYNHQADWDLVEGPSEPQQPGEPTNDAGLWYCAHVEDHGWLPPVHDGQVAGTVGYSKRMEALQVSAPEGWELYVKLHLQDIGWVTYDGITSGELDDAEILGTTGESRRIEDIIIGVSKRPRGDARHLEFRVHQQDVGWKAWTEEGYASGTDGMSIRLEAVQMRLVD